MCGWACKLVVGPPACRCPVHSTLCLGRRAEYQWRNSSVTPVTGRGGP
jgi:hypothetical protein